MHNLRDTKYDPFDKVRRENENLHCLVAALVCKFGEANGDGKTYHVTITAQEMKGQTGLTLMAREVGIADITITAGKPNNEQVEPERKD